MFGVVKDDWLGNEIGRLVKQVEDRCYSMMTDTEEQFMQKWCQILTSANQRMDGGHTNKEGIKGAAGNGGNQNKNSSNSQPTNDTSNQTAPPTGSSEPLLLKRIHKIITDKLEQVELEILSGQLIKKKYQLKNNQHSNHKGSGQIGHQQQHSERKQSKGNNGMTDSPYNTLKNYNHTNHHSTVVVDVDKSLQNHTQAEQGNLNLSLIQEQQNGQIIESQLLTQNGKQAKQQQQQYYGVDKSQQQSHSHRHSQSQQRITQITGNTNSSKVESDINHNNHNPNNHNPNHNSTHIDKSINKNDTRKTVLHEPSATSLNSPSNSNSPNKDYFSPTHPKTLEIKQHLQMIAAQAEKSRKDRIQKQKQAQQKKLEKELEMARIKEAIEKQKKQQYRENIRRKMEENQKRKQQLQEEQTLFLQYRKEFKKKKPLHVALEEEYRQSVELPDIQAKKQMLHQLKEARKISFEQLKQHEDKYMHSKQTAPQKQFVQHRAVSVSYRAKRVEPEEVEKDLKEQQLKRELEALAKRKAYGDMVQLKLQQEIKQKILINQEIKKEELSQNETTNFRTLGQLENSSHREATGIRQGPKTEREGSQTLVSSVQNSRLRKHRTLDRTEIIEEGKRNLQYVKGMVQKNKSLKDIQSHQVNLSDSEEDQQSAAQADFGGPKSILSQLANTIHSPNKSRRDRTQSLEGDNHGKTNRYGGYLEERRAKRQSAKKGTGFGTDWEKTMFSADEAGLGDRSQRVLIRSKQLEQQALNQQKILSLRSFTKPEDIMQQKQQIDFTLMESIKAKVALLRHSEPR